MLFPISDALAAGEAASAGGMESFLVQVVPLIVIFVVFWFFLIRPQQKRQKEHAKMCDALAKGDEVMTMGGISINEHLQALRPDQSVIPGLYVTGDNASNWMGEEYGPMFSSFCWAMNSGYLA